MKTLSVRLAAAWVLIVAVPAFAADTPQPVRMGSGLMTFDTVPGWGLGADGKSVIGPDPRQRRRRQGSATSIRVPTPESSSSRPTARSSAASSATSIPTFMT